MIGRTIYLTCLYIFLFLMSSKQQSGKGTVFSQKRMTTLHTKNSFRLLIDGSKIERSWINIIFSYLKKFIFSFSFLSNSCPILYFSMTRGKKCLILCL